MRREKSATAAGAPLTSLQRGSMEPVPFDVRLVHNLILKFGNHGRFAALSGRVTRSPDRGQASARGAEGMIEQRKMDQRHKGSPALDEARLRQQAIGVKLRQMFDEVVNEPVPDEFLDILRRADRASGES